MNVQLLGPKRDLWSNTTPQLPKLIAFNRAGFTDKSFKVENF